MFIIKSNSVLSLKEYVYKEIIKMICSGRLTTNTLLTEKQMIEEFAVSKAPVREALVQLCHENVLVSIPRSGYRVVEISGKNIRDITEMRLFLELSSLPSIMKKLDVDIMNELRELNAARRVGMDRRTVWACWNANVTFHLKLNYYAGNMQVNRTLEQALSTCTRAYAQLFTLDSAPMTQSNVLREHRHDLIVDALEHHDIFRAHEALRQDILFMEQQLLSTNMMME